MTCHLDLSISAKICSFALGPDLQGCFYESPLISAFDLHGGGGDLELRVGRDRFGSSSEESVQCLSPRNGRHLFELRGWI